MREFSLDPLDRKLLRLLQTNNRQPLREMAEALAVSAPTCMRRLQRLEKHGVIQSHRAIVDPVKVGFGVLAFVEICLVAPSGAEIRAFERRMQRLPEVVQCAELAGDVDYMLTIRTVDMIAFSQFSRKHFADDPSIKSFRSLLVMRQTKADYEVPV